MPDNLFVPEEEELPAVSRTETTTETAKSPHKNKHKKINKQHHHDGSDHERNSDDEDDPVVQEIPIFLNHIDDSKSELCLFQYISQLATKPLTLEKGIQIPKGRLKPKSNSVEIDIPLDTSQFFDSEKAKNWEEMAHETYGGHLIDASGNYVLCVREKDHDILDNSDAMDIDGDDKKPSSSSFMGKNKEIILTPVNKLSQIRPVFHHIDKVKDLERTQEITTNPKPATTTNKNSVQVVLITAKSAGSENEIRYSDAILTFKRAQDEEFLPLNWKDQGEEISARIKKNLYGDESLREKELKVVEKRDEYIKRLLTSDI